MTCMRCGSENVVFLLIERNLDLVLVKWICFHYNYVSRDVCRIEKEGDFEFLISLKNDEKSIMRG